MRSIARDPVTYTDEVSLLARDLQEGDLLFGLRVNISEPATDFIWQVIADNGTPSDTATAGLLLQVTADWPLTVVRRQTLGDDQCIVCKRHGIKYAAQHKCNACYQRERRQSLAG